MAELKLHLDANDSATSTLLVGDVSGYGRNFKPVTPPLTLTPASLGTYQGVTFATGSSPARHVTGAGADVPLTVYFPATRGAFVAAFKPTALSYTGDISSGGNAVNSEKVFDSTGGYICLGLSASHVAFYLYSGAHRVVAVPSTTTGGIVVAGGWWDPTWLALTIDGTTFTNAASGGGIASGGMSDNLYAGQIYGSGVVGGGSCFQGDLFELWLWDDVPTGLGSTVVGLIAKYAGTTTTTTTGTNQVLLVL